jgi:hypothetical protein
MTRRFFTLFSCSLPSAHSQMAPVPVSVKHNGKKYDLELHPSEPASDFKAAIYSVTGVEPDKQKVLDLSIGGYTRTSENVLRGRSSSKVAP